MANRLITFCCAAGLLVLLGADAAIPTYDDMLAAMRATATQFRDMRWFAPEDAFKFVRRGTCKWGLNGNVVSSQGISLATVTVSSANCHDLTVAMWAETLPCVYDAAADNVTCRNPLPKGLEGARWTAGGHSRQPPLGTVPVRDSPPANVPGTVPNTAFEKLPTCENALKLLVARSAQATGSYNNSGTFDCKYAGDRLVVSGNVDGVGRVWLAITLDRLEVVDGFAGRRVSWTVTGQPGRFVVYMDGDSGTWFGPTALSAWRMRMLGRRAIVGNGFPSGREPWMCPWAMYHVACEIVRTDVRKRDIVGNVTHVILAKFTYFGASVPGHIDADATLIGDLGVATVRALGPMGPLATSYALHLPMVVDSLCNERKYDVTTCGSGGTPIPFPPVPSNDTDGIFAVTYAPPPPIHNYFRAAN